MGDLFQRRRGGSEHHRARPRCLTGFQPWKEVSNCSVWVQNDLNTLFKDTSLTSPATADGDVLNGWQDLSGSSNHPTFNQAGFTPILRLTSNGINGQPAVEVNSGKVLYTPNFLTTSYQAAISIYLIVKAAAGQPNQIRVSTSINNTVYYTGRNSGVLAYYGHSGLSAGTSQISGDPTGLHVEASTYDGSQQIISVDGAPTTFGLTGNINCNGQKWAIGDLTTGGTFPWSGQFTVAGLFLGAHSATTRKKIEKVLLERAGIAINPGFICKGDSITAGVGATAGNDWVTLVFAALAAETPARNWTSYNKGVPGETVATGLSNINTEVLALLDTLWPRAALTIWEGTNDLKLDSSVTAATVYGNIKAYGAAAKAGGIRKVIAITMLPRNDSPPGNFESRRLAVNASLLADCESTAFPGLTRIYPAKLGTTWFDFVYDAASHPDLLDATTGQYADGVHPNNTGNLDIKNDLKPLFDLM